MWHCHKNLRGDIMSNKDAQIFEIEIGGMKIGSYQGTLDKYPNYVEGISILKTNGTINQYSIRLVHQIRVGDDPNLLDKLFAKNQFNKITIRYGDTDSGQMFNDINAIITDVKMQRNYASQKLPILLKLHLLAHS